MSSLILISGEEEFLQERAAYEEARSSLASDTLEYSMPDGIESYLIDSRCAIFNMGARVFILWDVKDIPQFPESSSDTLICVALSGKRVLQDKHAKRNLVFPKLKSFSDNNEVLRWILKEGNSLNIDLSRIAGALFVNSGSCLRKLSGEITKIAAAVPAGTVVTPDIARSLMCFSAELTPREIIDAICEGQTIKALALYDKMQERTDETGWIIAYMQRHVVQQIKLEKIFEQKMPDPQAAELLSIHPFIYKKMLITRRGLWSKKSLITSFCTLCDLDVSHKRGDQIARFVLETEITRLSEEARDVKR